MVKQSAVESFSANYQKLQAVAEQLSGQEDIDIDALVPKVDEAMAAYKVCKERIEKVNQMLRERLQDEGEEK